MTRQHYIVLGVAAIAVAVGLFAWRANNRAAKPAENVPPEIQVMKPSAYLVSPAGKRERELKTGEQLIAPVTVEVSKEGRANIYFSDGSVARLAGGTTITLREGVYDKQSGKLVTRISLAAGKVWSKIVLLATPDSMWQVSTAHAVATVRGSAFDMETDGDRTRIVGSEHNVWVAPVDPKTGEPQENKRTTLGENEVITASGGDVQTSAQGPAEASDSWIKENEEADQRVNDVLTNLAGENYTPPDPAEFREELIRRMENLREGTDAGTTGGTSGTGGTGGTAGTGTSASAYQSLKVVSRSALDNLAEGNRVEFRAMAVDANFAETDVTAKVRWQVVGDIGTIDAAGIFTAKLGASVAELGESFGSVVATWTDPATGGQLLGKSPIFRVRAFIPDTSGIPQG